MLSSRIRSVVSFSTFITFVVVWCAIALGSQRLLDLSGSPSRTNRETSVLGQFQGMRTDPFETDGDGNSLPYVWRPYALPLSVQIVSIEEFRSAEEPWIHIDLTLRNIGQQPYWIPISADQSRSAVLPGNLDRRQLLLSIKVENRHALGDQTIRSLVLDGSTTAASSLLRLAPAESLLLRFAVPLSGIAPWGATESFVLQAIVGEQQIANDQFFIWDYSQEIVSDPIVFKPKREATK